MALQSVKILCGEGEGAITIIIIITFLRGGWVCFLSLNMKKLPRKKPEMLQLQPHKRFNNFLYRIYQNQYDKVLYSKPIKHSNTHADMYE